MWDVVLYNVFLLDTVGLSLTYLWTLVVVDNQLLSFNALMPFAGYQAHENIHLLSPKWPILCWVDIKLYPTLPYVDDWADHACCQQRSLSAIQISVCWNSGGGGVVGSKLAIILRSAFYVRWCYQIFHLSSDVHFPSLQHAIFSCWCCCRVAGKEIVCMNSEQCARILWIVHKTCIVGFDTKASSNID